MPAIDALHATLGAVVFFPIVLNIMVITWALQCRGTVYVTSLMVFAAVCALIALAGLWVSVRRTPEPVRVNQTH
ncbi:MAG: hypothetical protein FJW21_07025 [Acidimicrobiia bacterium]|nr:hypothetical protein [Acidimicrobiia bacterium]